MSSPVFLTLLCEMTETATTDQVKSVPVSAPGTWRVNSIYLVDNDGVTADAANVTDLSVETGGAVEIASWDTTTGQDGTLTAKTPVAMTLLDTAAARHFDQGDALVFKKTDAGTGQGTTAFFAVTLEQVR